MVFQREEGQTMTEYAIVLAVITPAIVIAYAALSGGVEGAVNSVTALF